MDAVTSPLPLLKGVMTYSEERTFSFFYKKGSVMAVRYDRRTFAKTQRVPRMLPVTMTNLPFMFEIVLEWVKGIDL